MRMFGNYIKVIFRSFVRNKLYSLTNFFGLAVAMMGFIVVSLYVNYELSYDKFHENVEEIHMLKMRYPERYGGFYNQFVPPVFGKTIKEEIPSVEDVTVTGTGIFNIDVIDNQGNIIQESGYVFQPSFFDVFSFTPKYGDPRKALADPKSIVISRKIALKYFRVENVVGKTLKLKDRGEFIIGAVLNDFPNNSQFQPNIILPLISNTSEEGMINWGSNTHFVYMRISSGTNVEKLQNQIAELYTKNSPEGIYSNGKADLFPFQDSYWEWSGSGAALNNRSKSLGADKSVLVICSVLAIVLLLIALANYVNMATSRAIQRAKEVGVRKVNGASPRQLISQFLVESVAFCLISLLIALIGVELILPSVSQVMGIKMELDLLSINQATLLFGYVLVCGLTAGIYPAVFMARFNPSRVLKSKVIQGGKKLSLFKVLLGLQFTLSALLVTAILILNAQVRHYVNFDLGFDKDQVVSVNLSDKLRGNADALINELRSVSSVKGVTFGPLPASADGFNDIVFGEKEIRSVTRMQTDENFLPLMDIELKAGRNFDRSKSSDFSNGILINEKLADALELDQPVGAILTISGIQKTVIGVVSNFYSDGPMSNVRNLTIWPKSDQVYRLLAKVSDHEALSHIEKVYGNYESGPLKYTWLDDAYNQKYHRVSRVVTIINGSTVLTVFVSVFGLFAMLAFSISNRLKEIGVRKVLGAKFFQIQWSVARPFFVVSSISLTIAIPLAYILVGQMIQNFPNRIEFGLGFGLASIAITMLLNFVVVAIRGVSVANLNPVEILKDD